jgi:hypothetical protein
VFSKYSQHCQGTGPCTLPQLLTYRAGLYAVARGHRKLDLAQGGASACTRPQFVAVRQATVVRGAHQKSTGVPNSCAWVINGSMSASRSATYTRRVPGSCGAATRCCTAGDWSAASSRAFAAWSAWEAARPNA